MKTDQELDRLFKQEYRDILSNTIWKNNNGVYEVFGHYRIEPVHPGYRVSCAATDIGVFASTRTALSWCIADKNRAYNTARELLTLDNKVASITHDIATRAAVGDRSQNPGLREIILTKLESKIIQKKLLENQLTKCVNWAKQIQSREFAIEKNNKK